MQAGAFNDEGQKTRFYVLGLSPNAARISVRFWQVGTVAEMAARVCQHFKDVEIVHAAFEKPHLSLFRLLVSTAMQGKSENIPPNLAGETMRAILQGSPYPQTLLQAVIRRLRAEQAKKDDQTGKAIPNVSYPRAALIKACINRQIRHSLSSEKELIVSLDPTNTNTAYRLGRLFAVFERMQESAYERELNRTIRDTFFGAAMSTPRSVFPRLIRLNQHHLRNIKRSKPKSAGYFDGLLREINWGFNPTSAYPVVFQLEDQGRFAIGYYHQRQAFFKNSESTIQGA